MIYTVKVQSIQPFAAKFINHLGETRRGFASVKNTEDFSVHDLCDTMYLNRAPELESVERIVFDVKDWGQITGTPIDVNIEYAVEAYDSLLLVAKKIKRDA